MSDEIESGAGVEDALPGTDPAAMAVALNGASREEADAFLKKQSSLIDVQKHHLREQFKHLSLTLWEKRMGVALRVATAIMGLTVAGAIALFVRDAVNSNRLLIDAFSVSPDLATRGITGEVVAARLLDNIAQLQAQAQTARAPQTFANNWGRNDIKVDIPEAGISVGELDRFLREKFGNDTHVSGEVVRTGDRFALTARAGTQGAASVTGTEEDLDTLIRRLSESIYGLTQPYRYGTYLASHGRVDEAVTVLSALAKNGPAEERPWGYVGWSNAITARDGMSARIKLLQQAYALDSNFIPTLSNLGAIENAQSHPEKAFFYAMKTSAAYDTDSAMVFVGATSATAAAGKERYRDSANTVHGDYHSAALFFANLLRRSNASLGQTGLSAQLASYQAGEHDLDAARATMGEIIQDSGVMPGLSGFPDRVALMQIADQAADWNTVLSNADLMNAGYAKAPGARSQYAATTIPLIARAKAELGRFADAEKDLSSTPGDCYACLIMRAKIAEMQGQRARTDWWFDRAAKSNPSIPFAYAERGQALKERGDLNGAIAQFTIANQKGPHFADPLEGWGEALMAQNRSDLALTKFTEAEKYAPNWGRLHLKWGEALNYAGKKDEAQKQFALAATLDLTAVEKAELMTMRRAT